VIGLAYILSPTAWLIMLWRELALRISKRRTA
jgi:hypothetical protein